MTTLDHEQFEGAKILAEIGTKIAAGNAALALLETGKSDFLNGRAAEAETRIKEVLEQSKDLLAEIDKNYSALVRYRNQVDDFLKDVLYLIQSVERWKKEFEAEFTEKNKRIDVKIAQNNDILKEIKVQRALLEGETLGIKSKREALKRDATKIRDEWETLGRAKEEINQTSN